MAKRDINSPGGFKKVLQFIGIVDEVVPEQSYDNGYQSGQYGQTPPYTPNRSQNARTTRPSNGRRDIPEQGGRSNPRGYGRNEDVRRPQRPSRFEESYNESAGYQRPGRFEDNYDSQRPAQAPRSRFESYEEPQPRVRPQGGAPRGDSGHVVLTLYTLRDARKVIRALVAGQTVTMSISTDDDELRTRITDTLSGAIFAVGGTFRKAGDLTYVLAPRGVNVQSEGEMDEDD